jgi:hypothetical protein
MPDKILITNNTALLEKYKEGKAKIDAAIASLVDADGRRGLETTVVAIDDQAAMDTVGGRAVTSVGDEAANKAAVDAIYKQHQPDYLVLLGGPDIVPHIHLENTASDNDPDAPGDLPYACEAPFSQNPRDFLGPTRVVSRIPDITGKQNADADYLANLLTFAARFQPVSSSEFAKSLAVAAKDFSKSSGLTATNIFGSAVKLQLSPTKGPFWTMSQLQCFAHYFNCHGDIDDHRFGGEGGASTSIAHDASFVKGKVRPGTVVVAECCYGAQLYDPKANPLGMANTYLGNGASAYMGSTNISYGQDDTNDWADLLCRYFMNEIIAGSSVGLAMLHARQTYIQGKTSMGNNDLKTLAQFLVLGDASSHCVQIPTAAMIAQERFVGADGLEARARADRRKAAQQLGKFLESSRTVVGRASDSEPPACVIQVVQQCGFTQPKIVSFEAQNSGPQGAHSKNPAITAFHLIYDEADRSGPLDSAGRTLELQTADQTLVSFSEAVVR